MGLDPDKRKELRVPEALSKLIATRRQWVHSIGGMFDAALEHWQELTRRVYRLPERSIYDGLDAEIVEMQERTCGATGGAMGIGQSDDQRTSLMGVRK
jgi:transcriptional adapter 3